MTEVQFEDGDLAENQLPEGFARKSRLVDKPADADGVVIVDVSNLAYRSAYAYGDLTTKAGQKSGHVYGSLRLLQAMMKNHVEAGTWCFVFCYDGLGAKARRQTVLPAYKANREDGRFNPCPEVRGVFLDVPGIHIEAAGAEGDDAIAWAVQLMKGRPCLLLTGDRDLWALTRFPNVKVFSPNLKRYVKVPEDIEDHYHVTDPARIPMAKALFGDPSDGIKGVERLQKKQVKAILNESLVPKDFFSLYAAHRDTMTESTRAKLDVATTQVETNFQVVSPDLSLFSKTSVRHVAASEDHKAKLLNSFATWDCNSLVSTADAWFGEPFYVEEEDR